MVQESGHRRNPLPARDAVWRYLSDLWVAHLTGPATGVRPRVEIIARKVGYCRRTIFRALRQLEDAGILRRHHRCRANGEQTSSLYVLQQLYRLPGRHDVDNSAEIVDNSEAENRDALHDVTPLETSPLGDSTLPESYHSEREARDSQIPICWDEALETAYTRRIYEPMRADPARFVITLSKHEPFVNYLTQWVPARVEVGEVIAHIAERLADCAADDRTVVEKPQLWIAGYLRRLRAQGRIRSRRAARRAGAVRWQGAG